MLRDLWGLILGLKPGRDESLADVAMDAGVALVLAVVITEILRSLIG